MKAILVAITALILLSVAALTVLGKMSQSGNPVGILDGRLAPCPDKPNCVSSEGPTDTSHFTSPILLTEPAVPRAMQIMRSVLIDLKGEVQIEHDTYIAASFTSPLFGFVDDVEIRFEPTHNRIHIRSASRVGYGDLGANQQRVEMIKKGFSEHIQQ